MAVYDLLEENSFCLPDRDGRVVPAGPYRLHLAIREGRLVFGIATEDETAVGEFHLSLGPFRQVVKDYFQICDRISRQSSACLPARSRRSTWRGAAFTTKARGCCRSGWKARPVSTPTPHGGCSP